MDQNVKWKNPKHAINNLLIFHSADGHLERKELDDWILKIIKKLPILLPWDLDHAWKFPKNVSTKTHSIEYKNIRCFFQFRLYQWRACLTVICKIFVKNSSNEFTY